MITVSKKNEVYLKIDTDPSTEQELSDFFTFEVPGARFMPLYKNRMWDGKVRLFSQYTKELYLGLLPYVKEFANTLEYDLQINIPDLGEKVNVESFTKLLKLQSGGKDIQIRDYQIDAVRHALRHSRTLLLSPTASGKSLIIYTLIRYHQQQNRKQLIVVPTTSLVEQMYSDFIDYGWNDKYLHRIYQGHEKETDKPVIISTWQSLFKLDKKYFEKFGCVIGDEAHLFKSKSLTTIMTKLIDCKYRFGMTGTLDGTQTHRLVLEAVSYTHLTLPTICSV